MRQVLKAAKAILNTISKIFLVIAVFIVTINLFLHFTSQDKPKFTIDPIKENREEIYKVINDPKLSKTKEGKLSIILYRSMMCGMIGEACTKNPEDGDKNFNKSLFGSVTNLIVLPYANPPASGVYWAYSGLQNAGFVPKTYAAQGIGFASIRPLMKIWLALRNIAYLVLVLFIIAVGFMIMFRMKINPQTVVSLENALPKIVISLILISLSFAIAGFLIDLMYIVIVLIISILGAAGGLNVSQYQRQYLQAGPSVILDGLTQGFWGLNILWRLPQALLGLVPAIGATIRILGSIIGFWAIFPFLYHNFGARISDIFDFDVTGGVEAIGKAEVTFKGLFDGTIHLGIMSIFLLISLLLGPAIIIPLLIGLLIFFTVIFLFFRILFMLFSAYLKILLLIVLSPLYLLLEAIPGQSSFSSWFKNLLSELIIFPAMIAIFIFSIIVTTNASSGNITQFPFLVGINPKSFGFMLGMFFLFMTPDLVTTLKQLLVPKPMPLDTGLGVFFGGASTGFGGAMAEISKWAGLGYYISPIGKVMERVVPGFKVPHGLAPPHSASTPP